MVDIIFPLVFAKKGYNKRNKKTKGETHMKKLALITLLALAVIANATGTVIKWYDTTTSTTNTLQCGQTIYAIGFDSTTPGWASGPTITGVETDVIGSGRLKISLHNGAQTHFASRDVDFDTTTGRKFFSFSSDIVVSSSVTDLRVSFYLDSGGLLIKKDTSRNVSARYYTYSGTTWTPHNETQGDWIFGLCYDMATKITPSSLGRVKATFK